MLPAGGAGRSSTCWAGGGAHLGRRAGVEEEDTRAAPSCTGKQGRAAPAEVRGGEGGGELGRSSTRPGVTALLCSTWRPRAGATANQPRRSPRAWPWRAGAAASAHGAASHSRTAGRMAPPPTLPARCAWCGAPQHAMHTLTSSGRGGSDARGVHNVPTGLQASTAAGPPAVCSRTPTATAQEEDAAATLEFESQAPGRPQRAAHAHAHAHARQGEQPSSVGPRRAARRDEWLTSAWSLLLGATERAGRASVGGAWARWARRAWLAQVQGSARWRTGRSRRLWVASRPRCATTTRTAGASTTEGRARL